MRITDLWVLDYGCNSDINMNNNAISPCRVLILALQHEEYPARQQQQPVLLKSRRK
jgi:hypothetical protein